MVEKHVSPIARLYSKDELDRFFSENPLAGAEYDITYLGFADPYVVVSEIADKSMSIYDVGCCLGLQARFFRDFADYTGIDYPRSVILEGYPPYKDAWDLFDDVPGRFVAHEGAFFLENLAATSDEEERAGMLVIVSAVPDAKVADTAHALFPNVFSWYPGQAARVRGHRADAICEAFEARRAKWN